MAMPHPPSLLTKLAADWPADEWRDVTVLVAVSGGADSVALGRGLHQIRALGEGRLVIAHFNHRLRGAESDADQTFVVELGQQLGLRVVLGSRDEDGRASSEELLREQRYQFLRQAADETGARYVAIAHTADDQVETVLHNILRGTGLAGLAGIPRVRLLTEATTLIRPMLGATRAEVLEFLDSLGQRYREDSSNAALDYTRNRLRHELLPQLARDYNPHVREALLRLSQIAAAANGWLHREALYNLDESVRTIQGGIEIDVQALRSSPEFMAQLGLMALWRREGWPLQEMSHEKWTELFVFATVSRAAPSRQDFPGNIRAEKQGGVLRLTRPA